MDFFFCTHSVSSSERESNPRPRAFQASSQYRLGASRSLECETREPRWSKSIKYSHIYVEKINSNDIIVNQWNLVTIPTSKLVAELASCKVEQNSINQVGYEMDKFSTCLKLFMEGGKGKEGLSKSPTRQTIKARPSNKGGYIVSKVERVNYYCKVWVQAIHLVKLFTRSVADGQPNKIEACETAPIVLSHTTVNFSATLVSVDGVTSWHTPLLSTTTTPIISYKSQWGEGSFLFLHEWINIDPRKIQWSIPSSEKFTIDGLD